jgi:hypothetical protein
VWTRMKTCFPNKHESSRNRIRTPEASHATRFDKFET